MTNLTNVADAKRLPPQGVRPGGAGVSLIIVAVTGMMPGSKGYFTGSESRVLVVKTSEATWDTYQGQSWSADDRYWTDAEAMARYIQSTVL